LLAGLVVERMLIRTMASRSLALGLALLVGSWMLLPPARGYRCVGTPSRRAAHHSCCPSSAPLPTAQIGGPCCERLPRLALDGVDAASSFDAAGIAPAAQAVLPAGASILTPYATRAFDTFAVGVGPPFGKLRPLGTVLRI
jgi:hypothetical protein